MTRRIVLILFCIALLLGACTLQISLDGISIVYIPSTGTAVQATDTQEPTPTIEFSTSQPPLLGRVTTTKLNVRSAPGTNNPIVGSLFFGDVIFIIEITNDGSWYQVESPETGVLLGWVSSAFVTPDRQ